jgi:hypothetical protein
MRPRDFQGGDDPEEIEAYRQWLAAWEARRDELIGQQAAAAAALEATQSRLPVLAGWVERLRAAAAAAAAQAERLAAHDADLAAAAASLALSEGELADHREARELATARLLGGPPTGVAVVLLPLRLETRWRGDLLQVRIYPDVLSVDSHDPSLGADERTWGQHWWEVRAGRVTADLEETWRQLVRRFGAQRAAWIVHATDPDTPAAPERAGPWLRPALARLLPDRFAVVAFSAGEPVDLAPPGGPPQFVTWSAAVEDPLECGAVDPASPGSTWMRDLAAAAAAGMAVSLAVPPGAPPIDLLCAVGVRGGPDAGSAGGPLAELLRAQTFSAGAEVLADGTPTNNSGALRAAHSPRRQEDVARVLRDAVMDGGGAGEITDGTAGAQLADLLGLDRAAVAPLAGATAGREAAVAAARLLVGLGTTGALAAELGPDAAATWPLLQPGGPAPALRVGRQPYGVLPVSVPGGWRPRPGEGTAALAPLLHRWAAATGPVNGTDPGAPPAPVGGGTPRHVTSTDDADLAQLLLEATGSLRWSGDDGTVRDGVVHDGLDGVVGPGEGARSPSALLPLVAATAPADLTGLPADTQPLPLLGKVAVAAKRAAAAEQVAAVDAALLVMAQMGREDLARLLGGFLDAASHRFDAWVTAAAADRLTALRREHPGQVAVGAFGWAADVAAREQPASHGHVHAPSLGHAVTAAVLRSAFLGQRRQAWSTRLAQAEARLEDTRAALDTEPGDSGRRRAVVAALARAEAQARADRAGARALAPLDAAAEAQLSMAVDLSSRRVRAARWVLAAVRAGQPLGAVLGYQFERDLADAGLQQYLAAFRKLTRFRTGTPLERLEDARRERRAELNRALAQLAALRAAAAALQPPLTTARTAEREAAERLERARAAAAPYAGMPAELATLTTVEIPRLQAELATIVARRPKVQRHPITLQVP